MLTKAPKGTKDVIPDESYKWQYIENMIRKICDSYGYKEIRTPVFEHTELFERGMGDTTDVVQKEMYTFEDKGGRSITLRPEGTASAVRSYLENSLYAAPQPTKMYYIISCYRYEKPQAGRLREFHQFGVEAFGSEKPSIDAEIISMAMTLLNKLGVKGLELNINSIGCPKCRKEYNSKLKEYLKQYLDELCETCNSRYERNPLRILDCRNSRCKEIGKNTPVLLESLCDDCKAHFDSLKNYLDSMNIKYNVDPYIVRGLDYYTRTVFEFVSKDIGAQGTVCGGGRYDGLIEELGGSPTPGIGFGMGIERLMLTLEGQGIEIPRPDPVKLFIANIGEKAEIKAQSLVYELRQQDISAEKDHMGKSLKAQMKYADKLGAQYTMVLGEDEINNNKAVLKNMKTGETIEVDLEYLGNILKKI
ncbi:MAG: histidyl-tRNA synthetase [Petroclostridium sp.]|jgi:histidyl-tRNA synthetase|uniref:histidine--tRNA ligase n=1 Tax=Petroclostridium xylanilyticum TaxID=1792311 RepID=UPI000B9962C3|nr:histidine--tRNA ligase [Petroclostridium xylanilyticum]MBZ4646953.1 histidyl-tRNA synthetase [Clostridia bacterium]MDK2809830.1 histidyl-tRNA synthetase [Petroclostridium sp.]